MAMTEPEFRAVFHEHKDAVYRFALRMTGSAPAAAIAAAAPPAPRPTTKKKGRRRGKKPAQDEGGLFDPEQCGFAALVAKLNEITDNNHAEQASADTTVPLIAY